jgi:cell division protein FtsQ
MALYQGRALESRSRESGRPRGRLGLVLRLLAAIALATALAHLPWESMRGRLTRVSEIRVEGVRYLDPEVVAQAAGLAVGQDLFDVDCDRARQRLLLHPRVERATVSRHWPNTVRVRLAERIPVMLVRHGVPWEIDSLGVLLAPLGRGAVADVPLLAGASFEGITQGTRVSSPAVARGLAWVEALSRSELQLAGRVSEVDVGDSMRTALVMMNGTRVLAHSWPPEMKTLSALRVVLADLERSGTVAREVDLRFRDQVIVRPVEREHSTGAVS